MSRGAIEQFSVLQCASRSGRVFLCAAQNVQHRMPWGAIEQFSVLQCASRSGRVFLCAAQNVTGSYRAVQCTAVCQ